VDEGRENTEVKEGKEETAAAPGMEEGRPTREGATNRGRHEESAVEYALSFQCRAQSAVSPRV